MAGLIDEKFNLGTCDRLFIASTVVLDQSDEDRQKTLIRAKQNPDGIIAINDLLRHQFIELLLRVVKAKFIETGQANNYLEALNILFDVHISKYRDQLKPW